MKKSIALLLALVMVVSLFAACGNTQPTETTAPPAVENPTEGNEQTEATEAPESETALKLTWQQAIGVDSLFENPHKDKLTQSTALFTNSIAGLWVLPEHLLKDIAWADVNNADFWKHPIGTGPYMINEVKFPDYFTVTRYDGYWGEPAGIKNAQFVSYQSGGNDAAVAAVIAGEIDVAPKQIIADKAVADNIVAQNADVKSIMVSAFATRSFVFNNSQRADGQMAEY